MGGFNEDDAGAPLAHFMQHIRPLKALADNWDIDLAHELADYVDVVDKLTQQQHIINMSASCSTDRKNESTCDFGVNFTQAAFLIQNSAFVYAKKVQYLYNLTQEAHGSILGGYKSHELISSDRDSTENYDYQLQTETLDGSVLRCLDQFMTRNTSNNNTLPPATNNHPNSCLKDLISSFNVNLLSKDFELTSCHGESVGHRDEFEMNSSRISAETGVFFSSNFLAPEVTPQTPISCPGKMDLDDAANYINAVDEPLPNDFLQDIVPESETGISYNGHYKIDQDIVSEFDNGNDFETARLDHSGSEHDIRSVAVKRNLGGAVSECYEKFWSPLDPHSDCGAKLHARAFRKGIAGRAFKLVSKIINDHQESSMLPILEFLENQKTAKLRDAPKRVNSLLNSLDHDEFMNLSRNEPLIETPVEPIESDVEKMILEIPFHNVINEEYEISYGDVDDSEDEQKCITANQVENLSTSYHEQIENYLKNAKEFEYQIESSLAKRVRRWENALGPLMLQQNSRNPFDIEKYGENFLEILRSGTGTEVTTLARVLNENQAYDVCRYFLASLHLANAGEIVLDQSKEGTMTVQIQNLD